MAYMYSAQFLNSVIKAYDIRGLVESEITADFVRNVGRAFADFLKTTATRLVSRLATTCARPPQNWQRLLLKE